MRLHSNSKMASKISQHNLMGFHLPFWIVEETGKERAEGERTCIQGVWERLERKIGSLGRVRGNEMEASTKTNWEKQRKTDTAWGGRITERTRFPLSCL